MMFDKLELLALCLGSSCVVYLEINLYIYIYTYIYI